MATLFEKRIAYLKEEEYLKSRRNKITHMKIENHLRNILTRKDFNKLLEDTLIKNGYTEFAIKLDHEECDYIDYQHIKNELFEILYKYLDKGIFTDIAFQTVYFALTPHEVQPQFYFNKVTPTVSIHYDETADSFKLRDGQAYHILQNEKEA